MKWRKTFYEKKRTHLVYEYLLLLLLYSSFTVGYKKCLLKEHLNTKSRQMHFAYITMKQNLLYLKLQ